MQTRWPRENVHAVSLACDSASGTLVASTRFGLYFADIRAEVPNTSLQFKLAPVCKGTEGERLQDVALHCKSNMSQNSCQAVVLHQQGHRLAKCGIDEHHVSLSETPRK